MTCIQGEKNLNDLLSNQKEVVAKEGIGFAPQSKNKKKNDKTKRPPPLKQTFVKEGEGASKEKKNNVKGGGVEKGNATPSNKADDFNPSYGLGTRPSPRTRRKMTRPNDLLLLSKPL